MSLIDDFENAFQACLAPITNPISSHVLDNDELKANSDNIQRFIEISQQIENFFLRKRAILADQKPEFTLNEEIIELRNEIARKDNLLNHYYDKLAMWSNVVNEVVAGKPGINNMLDNNNQIMSNMVPHPQMRMGPAPSMMAPQMNPNHITQPHTINPMMRSQSGVPPGIQVSSPVMGQPQHSSSVFNPMNNSMQSPAQNPLAFLERTTAHIGMNDNRR